METAAESGACPTIRESVSSVLAHGICQLLFFEPPYDFTPFLTGPVFFCQGRGDRSRLCIASDFFATGGRHTFFQ